MNEPKLQPAKFLRVNVPNANGRVYPAEVVLNAINQFKLLTNQDIFPIFKEKGVAHRVEDIVGFASNVEIEDNMLIGEIGFIEGKTDFVPDDGIINIRPNGFGTIKDNVVQDDYRISGFCIVRDL